MGRYRDLLLATAVVACAPGFVSSARADEPKEPAPRMAYDPELTRKTVAFWRERAKQDPEGAIEWRELAGAYLALQRETGDISYAVEAEAAARKSLEIRKRSNAGALIRLGRALLTQHRFPEALEVAKRAATIDPEGARLVADVAIELGDYETAESALAGEHPKPDDLNYLALRSRLEELSGRPEAALRSLQEARDTALDRSDLPAETIAWYHTMIGHALIDTGRLDEGERSCREALAVFPRDYRAMTGLAESATWGQDWRAAADWARKAVAACPQNPEAIRLLGEALAELGDAEGAKAEYRRLEQLAASFPRIYDRHWILFRADHGRDLDAALALARKDLQLRQDVLAHDTLAWVCHKKGMVDEAEREMQKALSHGMKSAPLYHHAGVIAKASGDQDKAEAFFAIAKSLNPYLMKAAKVD